MTKMVHRVKSVCLSWFIRENSKILKQEKPDFGNSVALYKKIWKLRNLLFFRNVKQILNTIYKMDILMYVQPDKWMVFNCSLCKTKPRKKMLSTHFSSFTKNPFNYMRVSSSVQFIKFHFPLSNSTPESSVYNAQRTSL